MIQAPRFNSSDETIEFDLQAIGVNSTKNISLYRGHFKVSADFKTTHTASWQKQAIGANTKLLISVGRFDRKMVLESTEPKFQKIYPVAVGGFVQDYKNIQTPSLQGFIKSSSPNFYESREEPWYYYGFPFLGILNSAMNYTSYGLHATLLPAAENFNRGFVTTGCIQMQVKDVYEIFALIKYGNPQSTQLRILNHLPEVYAHQDSVVPFNNSYHYRVKDGSKGEDGLTKMIRVDSPPPLDL